MNGHEMNNVLEFKDYLLNNAPDVDTALFIATSAREFERTNLVERNEICEECGLEKEVSLMIRQGEPRLICQECEREW